MFPFQTLRAIVGGHSAIDVRRLHITDLHDAQEFLECYGYDWTDPEERHQLVELRVAALDFIQSVLLEEGERIPPAVHAIHDVRTLLIAVSNDEPDPWICGLLRVMHTLAHASSDLTERYADQIEAQILGRFDAWLAEDAHGLRFGDIPLVRFESRARKERTSLVLKLLHKPENVAADIFDRLGVRFVTHTRLDAVRLVRELRVLNVIMFANIKPSRSRNTLVDLQQLEDATQQITDLDQLAETVESWPYPDPAPDPANPFSSKAYHAIQFTARQRVRIVDAHGSVLRVFFPFEIQVLDQAGYERSRQGYASHADYKRRQREAARRRVLGDALG